MIRLFKIILWTAVVFLALSLVWVAAQYFSFDKNYHFLKMKGQMLNNPIWLTAFYIHLAFGIISVLAGLPLFFSKLVDFKSKLHKQLGKIYVVAIMFLTGPTGFYLSFQAEGGAIASVGFLLMSFMWMFLTYMAFHKIVVKKDVKAHNKWMIRSYCFTLSGVTLRVFTPVAMHYWDWNEATVLHLAAFLPWMFNMMIAEIIIAANRKNINNLSLNKLSHEKS